MQRLQIRGADVGQFLAFEIAPDLFDGVQLRRVAGQPFDGQPPALAREVRLHPAALVRVEAGPDEGDALSAEVALDVAEEADQPDVLVRGRPRLKEKAAAAR